MKCNRQKGKIRYLINFSHIEDWNVSKKSQVVCRIKNGTEPVVKRKIREPEHGRAEPVEEVLHQLNGDAGSRISSVVNERHVELRHIGRSAQPTNNNANRFGQKIRVVYPNRSKTLLLLIGEFCTTY